MLKFQRVSKSILLIRSNIYYFKTYNPQVPVGQLDSGVLDEPDLAETAKLDISFSKFFDPHFLHDSFSDCEKTRYSVISPQSLHLYSYNAIK